MLRPACRLASLAGLAVLVVETPLFRRAAGDARDGIAHLVGDAQRHSSDAASRPWVASSLRPLRARARPHRGAPQTSDQITKSTSLVSITTPTYSRQGQSSHCGLFHRAEVSAQLTIIMRKSSKVKHVGLVYNGMHLHT
jgi:hypothetical protein